MSWRQRGGVNKATCKNGEEFKVKVEHLKTNVLFHREPEKVLKSLCGGELLLLSFGW